MFKCQIALYKAIKVSEPVADTASSKISASTLQQNLSKLAETTSNGYFGTNQSNSGDRAAIRGSGLLRAAATSTNEPSSVYATPSTYKDATVATVTALNDAVPSNDEDERHSDEHKSFDKLLSQHPASVDGSTVISSSSSNIDDPFQSAGDYATTQLHHDKKVCCNIYF